MGVSACPLFFDLHANLPVGGIFTRTCSLTSVLLQTVPWVYGPLSQGVSGRPMKSERMDKTSSKIYIQPLRRLARFVRHC